MRALAVLAMVFWVSCAIAQDAPFRLIGTSGKAYSAVANGLRTWVEDGLVHGFAQVQVQDAPGSRVVWEFQFIGCESGRGTAVWSTRAAATTEPVSQKTYWTYLARDFPSNFIAPLCDLTKSQWQPMVSSK